MYVPIGVSVFKVQKVMYLIVAQMTERTER